jgi:phage anti-repressor protein
MDEGTKKTDGIPELVKKKLNRKWVDARTLHESLSGVTGFSYWIKSRINRYGLIEGRDYEKYFMRTVNKDRRERAEYCISPSVEDKIITEYKVRFHVEKNRISTFNIKGHEVRVFFHKGELWFFEIDFLNRLQNKRSCNYKFKEGRMNIITMLPNRITEAPYAVLNEWALLLYVFRTRDNERVINVSKWLVNDALPVIRRAFADNPPSTLEKLRQFIKSFRKEASHERA